VNRDPLYQKIEGALSRPLDGNAFQQCAAALLGEVYPNLAPLPGGDDAGMDGAQGQRALWGKWAGAIRGFAGESIV